VLDRLDAALGDEWRDLLRLWRKAREGVGMHLERLQIPGVDAQQIRLAERRRLELALLVNFAEHRHLQLAGERSELLEQRGPREGLARFTSAMSGLPAACKSRVLNGRTSSSGSGSGDLRRSFRSATACSTSFCRWLTALRCLRPPAAAPRAPAKTSPAAPADRAQRRCRCSSPRAKRLRRPPRRLPPRPALLRR